jgi:hypothetical protein
MTKLLFGKREGLQLQDVFHGGCRDNGKGFQTVVDASVGDESVLALAEEIPLLRRLVQRHLQTFPDMVDWRRMPRSGRPC